jgi:protein-tyrosine phosphatase
MGLLYRSTDLDKLQSAAMAAFEKLDVLTVDDLRIETERTAQPDRVPEGIDVVVCDVCANSTAIAAAQVPKALADPKVAGAQFGAGKTVALFEKGFRDAVTLPSALEAEQAAQCSSSATTGPRGRSTRPGSWRDDLRTTGVPRTGSRW